MSIKNNNTDAATAPGADNAAPVAAAEEQPVRGGSYVRNADGSLTQTEGNRFNTEIMDNQE